MKKYIIVALIAIFAVGLAVEGYCINPSGPNKPGDIAGMLTGRRASDPQRTFRLVRWAPTSGTIPLTADSIVIWETTTYGDGVTIATSTTSGDSRVAGVLVTAINSGDVTAQVRLASDDVGRINWGWLQTYGLAQVNVTDRNGVVTTGYAMGVSSRGAGTAGVFSGDAPAGSFYPDRVGKAGFFMETKQPWTTGSGDATGDSSVKCFVTCE